MKDNQIISDARGECRHEFEQIAITQNMRFRELECKRCNHRITLKGNELSPIATDYSDLSAWTPELYQFIEDEGLWAEFATNLKEITIGHRIASLTARHAFKLIRASTASKASALAQAIKERDQ